MQAVPSVPCLLAAASLFGRALEVSAFVVSSNHHPFRRQEEMVLNAKPQRLDENVRGVVYVNDKCINCAACSNFAPDTFMRSPTRDEYHVVYRQPATPGEIWRARSALAACPVAAIRVETLAERRHRAPSAGEKAPAEQSRTDGDEQLVKQMSLRSSSEGISESTTTTTTSGEPFPRRFLDDETLEDIYWLGHHNEKSFGATPYLFRAMYKGERIWIMVDTPKFTPSAVRAVESLTGSSRGGGPDYLFLTHVDDTADHGKWAHHYRHQKKESNLKRIFHAGDLGEHNWLGDETLETVEILLETKEAEEDNSKDDHLVAYSLDGEILSSDWQESCKDEIVILHTPGHSPGSITLYRRPSNESNQRQRQRQRRPGIIFTGDTYGWTTRDGGKMSAFERYGDNLQVQAKTLERLVSLDWDIVAPGHGHPKDYRKSENPKKQRQSDLQKVLHGLMMMIRPRW